MRDNVLRALKAISESNYGKGCMCGHSEWCMSCSREHAASVVSEMRYVLRAASKEQREAILAHLGEVDR